MFLLTMQMLARVGGSPWYGHLLSLLPLVMLAVLHFQQIVGTLRRTQVPFWLGLAQGVDFCTKHGLVYFSGELLEEKSPAATGCH